MVHALLFEWQANCGGSLETAQYWNNENRRAWKPGLMRSDKKQKVTIRNENNMKDFDKKNTIKSSFSKLQHKISEDDLWGTKSCLFRDNSESPVNKNNHFSFKVDYQI